MIDIRLPNINAATEAGQLQQIRSYLYQFAEQMDWAMKTIESGQSEESVVLKNGGGSSSVSSAEKKAETNFNEIKSLIIKSADIVNAYAEKIDEILNLRGTYAAVADFGDDGVAAYIQETSNKISATNANIVNSYTELQELIGVVGADVEKIKTNAYLKTGLLYHDDSGKGVYGLEIGQEDEFDGEVVFNRYARFTSGRLSFFNSSGTEIAYISGQTLYITEAKIEMLFLGRLTKDDSKFEGYRVDTSNGLEFKWVGGDY